MFAGLPSLSAFPCSFILLLFFSRVEGGLLFALPPNPLSLGGREILFADRGGEEMAMVVVVLISGASTLEAHSGR